MKTTKINQSLIRLTRQCLAPVATLAVLVLAAPAGAAAQAPPRPPVPGSSGFHACGTLVVNRAPWQNFIDGAPGPESGDHWIVDWKGSHASCRFAKQKARTLILRGILFEQATNPAPFDHGLCSWRPGSGHETIKPFQEIACALPVRVRRKTYRPVIEAFVDPDPTFIHVAPPPGDGGVED